MSKISEVFTTNRSEDPTTSVIEEVLKEGSDHAFLVCDVDDIVDKYMHWKAAMPRIQPFYAVKCNAHPVVLKCLAELGAGFDCATKYEIEAILKIGVSPNNIIFANPIKDINHINYANLHDVQYTTFDSISELEKCKDHYTKAKHLIRIRATAINAIWSFDKKFGCDPYTEAPILLQSAKNLGLNVVGVAFHVGSGCKDPDSFCNAIQAAKSVFDAASTIGFEFNMLDIGGGIIAFKSNTIYEMGRSINKALDEYFPNYDVKVISEPGRYLVRTAFTLAATIISVKPNKVNNNGEFDKLLYCIDNGIYGLFHKVTHGDRAVVFPWNNDSEKQYTSTLFGPTMAPHDIVADDIFLPKLNIGDWLIFKNMGDYTITTQTRFHGYEQPPIYFTTRNLKRYGYQITENYTDEEVTTAYAKIRKSFKLIF